MWISTQISQSNDQTALRSLDSHGRSTFLMRAGQALVTGKYHKARPYSVEALLLYAQCRYLQKEDADGDAWLIMGVSARLAMRMGYHRDPRHFANISPFEGEMRRRTFFIVETFDLLLSCQVGLPTVIHEEECDTEPPSNLLDEDFDEDCKILPPSRPPTDPTPMLYFSCKSRFAKLLKRVMRHALSVRSPSYEETMRLDSELHKMHSEIPSSLQMRPLSVSFTDQPHMILKRLHIALLYLKSLCILHRNQDKSNPSFAYSRKTCADAALQILTYQAEIYIASQPEGQLFNNKWMLSSLTSHEFLMAAMITCLDLYESRNTTSATPPENPEVYGKKYDALRLSHEMWASRKESSRDACRASNILAVMLSKIPPLNMTTSHIAAAQEVSPISQPSAGVQVPTVSTMNSSGSPSCYPTLPDISAGGKSHNNSYAALNFGSTDPLSTIFNESDNIDWASFENPRPSKHPS